MKLYIIQHYSMFRLYLEAGGFTFNLQEGSLNTCEKMKAILLEKAELLINEAREERILAQSRETKLSKRCIRKLRRTLLLKSA